MEPCATNDEDTTDCPSSVVPGGAGVGGGGRNKGGGEMSVAGASSSAVGGGGQGAGEGAGAGDEEEVRAKYAPVAPPPTMSMHTPTIRGHLLDHQALRLPSLLLAYDSAALGGGERWARRLAAAALLAAVGAHDRIEAGGAHH